MNTAKRILGAVVALTLALAPAVAQSAIPDARVSLRVEDRELSEVVQYLRDQSGYNIVVLKGGETPVTLDVINVPWNEALELAAEMAGCVVEERTAGVLVVDQPPRVSISFDDAELKDVIDVIAKISGANIVIAPEVTGSLSLRLTDVPWRDALEVATKTLGFVVVEEARGILRVVDPLSLQSQMETRSYQLRYVRPPAKYLPMIDSEYVQITQVVAAQAQTNIQWDQVFPVIGALQKALTASGEMDYIASQNVLIVKDTAQVHAEIKAILDRLDTEPAQVLIDVKFVSTSNSDLFSLGVDYGDLGPVASASGGSIPITLPFNLGAGGFEDLIIADPSGTGPFVNDDALTPQTVFGSLSFTQWMGTLRLLQRDTTSEVMQAPKIWALDGREATIFVGETIRYAQAKSEQGQAGGLQLSVEEADSSPVGTGFQLLVIPHIIPGTTKVEMDIIPKETSLTGVGDPSVAPPGFDVFTVGASGLEGTIALPRERSSTIVTSLLVDSGQTAILGGLTTEFDTETISRVPYLADIPLLGWFFEHEERSRDKDSLWVFVTPTVIRSTSDTQRVLERELLNRHGAYGERLHQILYGDEGEYSTGHVRVESSSAPVPVMTDVPTVREIGEAPAPVEEAGEPEATGGEEGATAGGDSPNRLSPFVQAPEDPPGTDEKDV